MNKQKPKVLYDKASGVLSIEVKRGRGVDSNISGNVVIDYDRRGDIVRVNLYPFSFDAFRQSQRCSGALPKTQLSRSLPLSDG